MSRRSQSFKQRSPRPGIDWSRRVTVGVEDERRRSTPNVHRRSSLQRNRTDCWPEAKHPSEVEERFLRLPDSESFTRVRQFKIDAKGAVVSRGDSFRRKQIIGAEESSDQSRTSSISSTASSKPPPPSLRPSSSSEPNHPIIESLSPPRPQHKIAVLGQPATGKSALVAQFNTSEYRNPFALDSETDKSSTVSINIGGKECDLVFFQCDSPDEKAWSSIAPDVFLLLYSIDSRSSFRHVLDLLNTLRGNSLTRNVPIVLAANKIDLERRRTVSKEDAMNTASTYGLAHFEISVALNHRVDDLLIGLVAEIDDHHHDDHIVNITPHPQSQNEPMAEGDFRAAIRRFSQRNKTSHGSTRCMPFSPRSLLRGFRRWRSRSKFQLESS